MMNFAIVRRNRPFRNSQAARGYLAFHREGRVIVSCRDEVGSTTMLRLPWKRHTSHSPKHRNSKFKKKNKAMISTLDSTILKSHNVKPTWTPFQLPFVRLPYRTKRTMGGPQISRVVYFVTASAARMCRSVFLHIFLNFDFRVSNHLHRLGNFMCLGAWFAHAVASRGSAALLRGSSAHGLLIFYGNIWAWDLCSYVQWGLRKRQLCFFRPGKKAMRRRDLKLRENVTLAVAI